MVKIVLTLLLRILRLGVGGGGGGGSVEGKWSPTEKGSQLLGANYEVLKWFCNRRVQVQRSIELTRNDSIIVEVRSISPLLKVCWSLLTELWCILILCQTTFKTLNHNHKSHNIIFDHRTYYKILNRQFDDFGLYISDHYIHPQANLQIVPLLLLSNVDLLFLCLTSRIDIPISILLKFVFISISNDTNVNRF